jgi:predicted transcriptional regulator
LQNLDGPDSPDPFSFYSSSKSNALGRRSRTEMMVDVLRAVRGGAVLPTTVMYRSNLSWSVCQHLLKHLAAKGLLETRPKGERRLIVLTPKGSLALSGYCRAVEEIAD